MVAVEIYDRISTVVNPLNQLKLRNPRNGDKWGKSILKASARFGKIHSKIYGCNLNHLSILVL